MFSVHLKRLRVITEILGVNRLQTKFVVIPFRTQNGFGGYNTDIAYFPKDTFRGRRAHLCHSCPLLPFKNNEMTFQIISFL